VPVWYEIAVVTCGARCYLRNRAVSSNRITIGTIAGHLTGFAGFAADTTGRGLTR
jgi:hypothetical protein